MPTQEERLTTVEQNFLQFKTEAVRTYQDIAMHLTMLKGLTEATIGRLSTMQWQIDQRFNTVDITLNEHTERMIRIETTLSKQDERMVRIETTLTNQATQLSEHKMLLTEILARLPEKP